MKPVSRGSAWPARYALLALGLGIARPALAQESAFSLQFLGASEETGDARARGLGVLGIGLDDHRTAITLNPAALGGLNAMTISVMGLGGARLSTSPEGEDKGTVARFPQARGALPLFGKVVANVGLVALRNFRSDFTLGEKQIEGFGYVQRFERDGDVYTIPMGLSGNITSRVRLGATFDFLLGTLEESWVTEGDSIVALRSRRQDEMRGRTFTLGWMVIPVPGLRVGGSWNPEFNVERTRTETLEDARTTTSPPPLRKKTSEEDIQFPQALRLGVSADLGARFLVAGDYLWRQWEQYDGSLYEAEAVGNESRLGGGVEWVPGKRKYSYRLGGSHTTWPQSVGGDRLQESAVHFGMGVVFSAGGRLDLSLEHAWIGSLDTNGMKERAWRLGVSLSGQEVWKRRSPRG
jgi:hypothetical protein